MSNIFSKYKITYFGVLRSMTSWSKISGELINSFLSLGVKINIYERKGFLYKENFPLRPEIKRLITNKFKGDIVFTFEHPINYIYLPKNIFKIGILVYEFSKLPSLWVENINRYLDLVIVPSGFCKDIFLNSGIEPKKLKVLRFGFNPVYYYTPKRRVKKDKFIFLCIANPHKREGLEYLLEAYAQAFKRKEKVKLILKLAYIPQGKIKEFEYPNIERLFIRFKENKQNPHLQVIYKYLTESQISELYRSADCYVSLSRAEAFGLCFLEALACGLKVISVRYGGQLDFLNEKNASFINYYLVPARGEEYEKVESPIFISLPDIKDAKEIMRRVYENKDFTQNIILPYPEYFWWKNIAKDFLNFF